MTHRASHTATALVPARALLHPLWLASLAVLVLNDHVLKGASVLPEALTGKLSDFAGLVVAPVLLAVVLGVRRQRGWVASHVAVGVGFAAIQLSASAAQQWSAAMAAVGFPWHITRDVTDLVALPALALSLVVLHGAMRRRVARPARRTAEVVAAGTGLVCCAATSPPPEPAQRPDLFTDVYVHNGGESPLVVRMRGLSERIDLDCSAVAEDPGRLITEPLFGESRSFLLEPDQNFGLRANNEWDNGWDDTGGSPEGSFDGGCFAYLLDVDGLPPAVVFWEEGSIPSKQVPSEGFDSGGPRGGIDLLPSEDPDRLGGYDVLGDDIVHLVPPAAPPVEGACAPQGDSGRIEWSEPPIGSWELVQIDRGADGCFAVDLGSRDIDGELVMQDRWYLCVPLTDLSLEPGRSVRVSNVPGQSMDEGGVALVTDDEPVDGQALVELVAFRGDVFPGLRGLNVAAAPEFECGYVVDTSCGTITRATSVTAGGGAFGIAGLLPGEVRTFDGERGTMTIAVAHSEERAGLDPDCAEGRDTLGLDLEVAALYVEPSSG